MSTKDTRKKKKKWGLASLATGAGIVAISTVAPPVGLVALPWWGHALGKTTKYLLKEDEENREKSEIEKKVGKILDEETKYKTYNEGLKEGADLVNKYLDKSSQWKIDDIYKIEIYPKETKRTIFGNYTKKTKINIHDEE